MTRKIEASEFDSKCLAVLDEVEKSGERLVVLRNGRSIVEIIPHTVERQRIGLLGLYKGRMEILGDIISPIEI